MDGRTLTSEYAAAFLDGEGCFRIGGGTGTPMISCKNQHYPTVLAFLEKYGGNVLSHQQPLNGRWIHEWYCYGAKALAVVEDTIEYLWQKKPQAELLIEWSKTSPKSEARIQIKRLISELKRVDYAPVDSAD